MDHKEYLRRYIWKRVDFDSAYGYQCVDLTRHYCASVRWYLAWVFGGSAIAWWENRKTTFKGKQSITGFPKDVKSIKQWDVVIFKAKAKCMVKYPWVGNAWKSITFGKEWHVGQVDYVDNDGVLRIVEQNGNNGRIVNGKRVRDGLGENAIRIMGYMGKDAVAGFILQ